MPYIKERRDLLDVPVEILVEEIQSTGELNYVVTSLIHKLILHAEGKLNYEVINTMIGALECAKLELYRKIAGPYEDKKSGENGNISELDDNSKEQMR